MILLASIAANNGLPAANYLGVTISVLGICVFGYFMFMRRFQTPSVPPGLEAGMAQISKAKTESAALLEDASTGHTSSCCVVS
jgi:hypothetical protein